MALPSSGAISLSNIAGEHGGSTPHSINEYYRGGSNVSNTPANSSVPTSGQIDFADFYGTSAASADNNVSFTVQNYTVGTGKNAIAYDGANGSMSDGSITTNNLNSYTITDMRVSTFGLAGFEVYVSGSGNGYNIYNTGNVRGLTIGGTTYPFVAPVSGANSINLNTGTGTNIFQYSNAYSQYMAGQRGNSVTITFTY